MKTKLARPVLVKSNIPTNLVICAVDGHLHKTEHYGFTIESIIGKNTYQQLILISLEDEKIEVGDLVFNPIANSTGIIQHVYKNGCNFGVKKVIATQDQLSPEYIQQFVEQYNNRIVKDVEIEMQPWTNVETCCNSEMIVRPPDTITCPICNKSWMNLGCGVRHLITHYKPKLTNGFITIVEKK